MFSTCDLPGIGKESGKQRGSYFRVVEAYLCRHDNACCAGAVATAVIGGHPSLQKEGSASQPFFVIPRKQAEIYMALLVMDAFLACGVTTFLSLHP